MSKPDKTDELEIQSFNQRQRYREYVYCNDCGQESAEPLALKEPHGETLYWCPHCKSGDWVYRREYFNET